MRQVENVQGIEGHPPTEMQYEACLGKWGRIGRAHGSDGGIAMVFETRVRGIATWMYRKLETGGRKFTGEKKNAA